MKMNRILKLIGLVTCMVSLLAFPAKTADVGFAVGAAGNYATFDTTGTEREGNSTNTNTDTETASTSIEENAVYGSFFAEIVAKGDMAGITLGAEFVPGEAELGAKSRIDTNGVDPVENDDGTYTAKADVSDYWSVYLEPTIYLNDNVGFFVKGGYSQLTVNSVEDGLAVGTDSATYGEDEVTGTSWGYGLRAKSDAGVLMKLEYIETEYDTVTLDSTTGNKSRITADVDQQVVKISIGYQF